MATLDSISVTKNSSGTPVVLLQIAVDGAFTDQDASTIKAAINEQLGWAVDAKVQEAVAVIGKLDPVKKAEAIAAAQVFKEAVADPADDVDVADVITP